VVGNLSRRQIDAARAEGRDAQRRPWWPIDVRYERDGECVVIRMRSGMSLVVPRSCIPELEGATARQLENVEVSGEAVRWDGIDVDVSVPGLLSEMLGPTLSTQAAGRRGGTATSPAKAAASRANGRRGGRPRKRM
jgi:hypothetical protein